MSGRTSNERENAPHAGPRAAQGREPRAGNGWGSPPLLMPPPGPFSPDIRVPPHRPLLRRARLGGAWVPLTWLALSLAGICQISARAAGDDASPAPPSASRLPGGTAAPDGAAAPDGVYTLSPDDKLSVSVLNHPELSRDVTLMPDGTFNYDVVGTVHAAGLTATQLTRALTKGLSRELNQPEVTVTVREGRPRKVSVLGAVRSPGLFDCRTGTRLLDVLATCGGLAQSPDATLATLVTAGGTRSAPIDMAKLLSGADVGQNLPLAPGDILLVTAKDPALSAVQVSGEVARPGPFPVPAEGVSLENLLAQAGGPTPRAALAHVQVLHAGRVRTVDLHASRDRLGGPAAQVRLFPGDALLLPTNRAQFIAQGEVRSPGVYPIPDGEAVPLTLALAQAGGATADGDKQNVSIVRQGANGQPVILKVDADALFRGKAADDVGLRPGDILYVQTRRRSKSAGDVLQQLAPLALLSSLLRGGL